MKEKIGKRVRDARERKKISQEKLAELAGTSLTCISRLENGKSMVSLEKLRLIAQVLDTGLGELLQDFIEGKSDIDFYMDRLRLLFERCTTDEQDFLMENMQNFVSLQERKR